MRIPALMLLVALFAALALAQEKPAKLADLNNYGDFRRVSTTLRQVLTEFSEFFM